MTTSPAPSGAADPGDGPRAEPLDAWLAALWAVQGTDLLVTADSAPLQRVDGDLRPTSGVALTADDTDRIAAAVLGPRLTAEFRRRNQVDFAFTWRDLARVRGNAFRQRGATALALRVIPQQIPDLDRLALPPVLAQWADLPRGLVLVTGPTGSGKSTTLAAVLDHVNRRRAAHILTIEDPIEYVHAHQRSAVSQREVGTDTSSFAEALRAALREDPDVVLIGEMRDPESIAAALTIAETGHLVLASLHTNDAAQTLDRIVDVFPGDRQPQVRLQLAHVLVGILNQRLVRRVDAGRVAVTEVLVATSAVRNMIREGKTRQIRNVIATGHRDGMHTLESRLNALVAAGLVAPADALATTAYPEEIVAPRPPAGVVRG